MGIGKCAEQDEKTVERMLKRILLLWETGAQSCGEFLDDGAEHTSKLRAAPGDIKSFTLPASSCSKSHRKPLGREIADAWDRKPLARVGTMKTRGI